MWARQQAAFTGGENKDEFDLNEAWKMLRSRGKTEERRNHSMSTLLFINAASMWGYFKHWSKKGDPLRFSPSPWKAITQQKTVPAPGLPHMGGYVTHTHSHTEPGQCDHDIQHTGKEQPAREATTWQDTIGRFMFPSLLWVWEMWMYNRQPEALSRPLVLPLALSYPFLLPSDSIMSGLEREPPGMTDDTPPLLSFPVNRWFKSLKTNP